VIAIYKVGLPKPALVWLSYLSSAFIVRHDGDPTPCYTAQIRDVELSAPCFKMMYCVHFPSLYRVALGMPFIVSSRRLNKREHSSER